MSETISVHNMFELGIFMYSTCDSMNNLSSYCGLIDAKMRASDKELPVDTMSCSTGQSLSEVLLLAEHVVYKNCSECQKQFLYTTCSPRV